MKILDIIYKVILILYSLCLRCARYIKSRRRRVRKGEECFKRSEDSNRHSDDEEVI